MGLFKNIMDEYRRDELLRKGFIENNDVFEAKLKPSWSNMKELALIFPYVSDCDK